MYLEDQYEIAKSAVTEEVNGYIVFVMAENADSIAANMRNKALMNDPGDTHLYHRGYFHGQNGLTCICSRVILCKSANT